MENYIVAALSANLPKYEQCLVVKEGDVIIATHSKVFGPDSKEACEKWVAENCSGGSNPDEPKYIVAALTVSSGAKYEQCIVAKETDVIPATHSKVFGPASKEECEKWAAENCGKSSSVTPPTGSQTSLTATGSKAVTTPTGDEKEDEKKDEKENDVPNSGFRALTYLQYGLIGFVTIAFVVVIMIGASKLFGFRTENDTALVIVRSADDAARILITFLVAVATVAIAFLAILTAMVIREYKERFALAKEVLTILVGILGTIVGFYFGTATNPAAGNPPANTAITVNAGNTGNSGNTGNTRNSGNTGNTGNSGNAQTTNGNSSPANR